MAEDLLAELIRLGMKAPEKPGKVADWLRNGSKAGNLEIPSIAQKGGRPRKSS